jgi:RsiW-degrading membrane proteinase PrsW (M82 family)
MNTLIILSAALLPALVLLLYIYRRDPEKEPLSELLKAFFLGVSICVPVAFAEHYIHIYLFGPGGAPTSILGSTAMAFLVAALPEETAKLIALWLIVRKNRYFDEHFDGIVYAVCVGLGFAASENVGYVMGHEDWMSVALGRAFLAVPGHYAFAVMMGYYYSLYHFVDRSWKNRISILLVPVMAHGVYDSLAMSGTVDPLLGGISFVILIYFCIKLHKEAYRKIQHIIDQSK